mmetsp:Transcript_30468/g.50295  ORF Transcript_30468/g.50295 Transcript_30468/m.50295 type:complete len:258 (-) Transcript_30468:119-892(-)
MQRMIQPGIQQVGDGEAGHAMPHLLHLPVAFRGFPTWRNCWLLYFHWRSLLSASFLLRLLLLLQVRSWWHHWCFLYGRNRSSLVPIVHLNFQSCQLQIFPRLMLGPGANEVHQVRLERNVLFRSDGHRHCAPSFSEGIQHRVDLFLLRQVQFLWKLVHPTQRDQQGIQMLPDLWRQQGATASYSHLEIKQPRAWNLYQDVLRNARTLTSLHHQRCQGDQNLNLDKAVVNFSLGFLILLLVLLRILLVLLPRGLAPRH